MRIRYLIIGWAWSIAVAWGGDKLILIDLSKQRLFGIEKGKVVLRTPISSGRIGHETPVGSYKVLEKKRRHVSNLWPKPSGGAVMPYMLRINYNGIAIHAGATPRTPASHGCIRLPKAAAKRLFDWADVHTPVRIRGNIRTYLATIGSPLANKARKSHRQALYEIVEVDE